jgi:hypothetical protein
VSLIDKAKGLLGVGPVHLPESAPAPAEAPLYIKPGGEGEATSRTRRIVAFQKLPDRRDTPLQERYLLLEADMREAMALGARKVLNKAAGRSNGGWEWDADDIEYDVASIANDVQPKKGDVGALRREAIPTLVVTLVIRRPA